LGPHPPQVGDIPTLVAYAKAAGGRLGLYGDRGTSTCGGRVGQAGYEAQDAQVSRAVWRGAPSRGAPFAIALLTGPSSQLLATWGVEYWKEDSCNAPPDHETAFVSGGRSVAGCQRLFTRFLVHVPVQHEYALFRDGLNATGKPIQFALCG